MLETVVGYYFLGVGILLVAVFILAVLGQLLGFDVEIRRRPNPWWVRAITSVIRAVRGWR